MSMFKQNKVSVNDRYSCTPRSTVGVKENGISIRAVSSRVSWVSLPGVFDVFTEGRMKSEGESKKWFDLKTEYPQTTFLSSNNFPIEQEFRNRTFVWVRLPIVRQSDVRLSSTIERLVFDWVRLPNCWIRYPGKTLEYFQKQASGLKTGRASL